MRLYKQVALVTGSSRGIGAAIALRLAEEGADVVINYLDTGAESQADAQQIASKISALGRRSILMPADIRDPIAIEQMMDQVFQEFGKLDILVNNAGIGIFSTFLDTTLQAWTDTFDTNLRAAFLCSQIAARCMASNGFGRIINITSTGSVVAIPTMAHYCAAKAGLAMLTKAMAAELGPMGITVNAVGPSTIRTQMNAALLDEDNMEAREAAFNPTRRIGVPADIAAAVAFLASDEASWINGQNLIVDGGLTALSPQPSYEPI